MRKHKTEGGRLGIFFFSINLLLVVVGRKQLDAV